MKVSELKAILEELPNDCKIVLVDLDGERHDIEEIKYCKAYKPSDYDEVVEIVLSLTSY